MCLYVLLNFQAASHNADDKALVIVADDTDVFVLLLHYRHAGALHANSVYMQSPIQNRTVIDIDATVENHLSVVPHLLSAHALTGCDTVASYYGIGKGMALKVLKAGILIHKTLFDGSFDNFQTTDVSLIDSEFFFQVH